MIFAQPIFLSLDSQSLAIKQVYNFMCKLIHFSNFAVTFLKKATQFVN